VNGADESQHERTPVQRRKPLHRDHGRQAAGKKLFRGFLAADSGFKVCTYKP
jgi:hypothetical protein